MTCVGVVRRAGVRRQGIRVLPRPCRFVRFVGCSQVFARIRAADVATRVCVLAADAGQDVLDLAWQVCLCLCGSASLCLCVCICASVCVCACVRACVRAQVCVAGAPVASPSTHSHCACCTDVESSRGRRRGHRGLLCRGGCEGPEHAAVAGSLRRQGRVHDGASRCPRQPEVCPRRAAVLTGCCW
jgi:hypothetical protein